MALRKSLILRRPQSGRLEGRTVLLQLNFNPFARAQAGVQGNRWSRDGLDSRVAPTPPPRERGRVREGVGLTG